MKRFQVSHSKTLTREEMSTHIGHMVELIHADDEQTFWKVYDSYAKGSTLHPEDFALHHLTMESLTELYQQLSELRYH